MAFLLAVDQIAVTADWSAPLEKPLALKDEDRQ